MRRHPRPIETEAEPDALAASDTPPPARTLGDTSLDHLWIASRCRWGCGRRVGVLPFKLAGWPEMEIAELQARAKCSVCGRVVEISEQWGGVDEAEGTPLPDGFITPQSHPGHAVVGHRFRGWDGRIFYCDCYEPGMGYWLVNERAPTDRRVCSEADLRAYQEAE